jgi:superfamily II DNA/RNA helicase
MEQEEDDLKLSVELRQGIGEAGMKELTPLQRRTISALAEGKDVVVDARVGRGKTTAMVVGILQRIAAQGRKDAMQVLVVVPVRELAVVTDHIVRVLGVQLDLTTQSVMPGGQNHSRLANAQVVTSTPGRLHDILERDLLDPEQVRMLVFDEPGRMVDMGFADDIDFIIKSLPTDIQLAMFTDSMTDWCKDLVEGYMSHPVYITDLENI